MVCKKIVKKNTKTYSVTCGVGVLNRKYELVGSEFKFWPSNAWPSLDVLSRMALNRSPVAIFW